MRKSKALNIGGYAKDITRSRLESGASRFARFAIFENITLGLDVHSIEIHELLLL